MADTKPSSAVTVAPTASAPMVYQLDEFPEEQFNRLIPTQAIRVPTDLLVPVVQVVRLSSIDGDKDTYASDDTPRGERAPTARGLNKLSTAAGVSFYNERRVDDGSEPLVCRVSVDARMVLPTGAVITATGTKQIDVRTRKFASDAHRAKFVRDLYEQASTRARNRAIRAILSLKQSYTLAELQKAFAVVSFAPNMNHPLMQQAFIERLAPAIEAGFGPESGSPRLVAGSNQQLPEAPDDDTIVEGKFTDSSSSAAGSPGGNDGSPAAAEEPDWFVGAAGPPRLVAVLREKAETSGMSGDMTEPQKSQVQAAFRGPGTSDPIPLPVVTAGLRALWGVEPREGKLPLTAAQAQAIINCARDDDFRRLWVEAFGSAPA